MTELLLITAVVIIACALVNNISNKIGIPILLIFIVLGMLMGSDGILKLSFDNYLFAERICSVALIFIMFYGGFGTNWKEARPVAGISILLSTVGVVLTAGLTGLFCHYILGMEFLESMLIGAVLSSTDAASVFSILRSKKLGLKYNTASLLEVESGSNDPSAYMLTVVILTVMSGTTTPGKIGYMIFAQFTFGILIALVIAAFSVMILKRFRFSIAGFDAAFVIGVAVLSYALSSALGGNGYLSAYIVGIILGNADIPNKSTLVPFFDGVTGLMQMMVFFLLGLLSFPSHIPQVIGASLVIALFLTFVGRPVAVWILMKPFRCSNAQILLVSFAGLRGAASIVFATMATVSDAYTKLDVFHIVFCIVLLSIAIQGTLIPWVSKKTNMLDKKADVRKTFNDYSEELEIQFVQLEILSDHMWVNCQIQDLTLPSDVLIVMIVREGRPLIPNGATKIEEGDSVVISAPSYRDEHGVPLIEHRIKPTSKSVGKSISQYSKNPGELIILIKRGGHTITPCGDTILQPEDVLVLFRMS